MPATEAARVIGALAGPADEMDYLKRRGLYVDMDRSGQIRGPFEITEAQANSLLARARQAAESAGLLLAPQTQARLANPPAEAIELARALVEAGTEMPRARTHEAAVEIVLSAVSKLRHSMAVKYSAEQADVARQ